jgi:hypothetical protein
MFNPTISEAVHMPKESPESESAVEPAVPDTVAWTGWIWKYRERLVLGCCCATLIMLSLASLAPIRSAVQIGADEYFEVTKGFLWAKGYSLYDKVWNDQLPLHTVLLGTCFKVFGPTIGVARGLAVGFGFLLLFACFFLVKKRCGLLAAFAAAASLLVSPWVFELSISAMLEVPAIGVALCALWPVYKWTESPRKLWLVGSALVLAAALQIKPTAAIVVPALAAEIVMGSKTTGGRERTKGAVLALLIWGASIFVGFLLLGVVLGSRYGQLWASHFSSQTMESNEAQNMAFSPRLIFNHTEAFWGASIGLLIVFLRRDWRRLVFPVALLLTVTGIHLKHHPWWYYYYLHFAVPLAWLTGYAVAELLRRASTTRVNTPSAIIAALVNLVPAAFLVWLILVNGGMRLVDELQRIRDLPRIEDSPLIVKMRQFEPGTKWVYSHAHIHAFHARLAVIPELAVMPAKRRWSGQISKPQIFALRQQYRPEQVLLKKAPISPETQHFLDAGYSLVYEDETHSLYVADSLVGNENAENLHR